MIDFQFPYWGPLLFQAKIDNDFVALLLKKGKSSQKKNNDARKQLAGVIDKEYNFDDWDDWFAPKFDDYINAYVEVLQDYMQGKANPFKNSGPPKNWFLDNLWINYQRALEYNPLHMHSGDLSFVIYLQVPKELKKEAADRAGEHNTSSPGSINFHHGLKMAFSITEFVKFPEVGDLFIFPAWLPHYVHAFKSKVERISVSGNITFTYNKIDMTSKASKFE